MNNITLPWTAEVVLISWRSVNKQKRPPLPSELLATFIVFGTAGLVTQKNPQVGSLFGWGIVIATLLNLFDPANPLAIKPGASAPDTTPFKSQPNTKLGKVQ